MQRCRLAQVFCVNCNFLRKWCVVFSRCHTNFPQAIKTVAYGNVTLSTSHLEDCRMPLRGDGGRTSFLVTPRKVCIHLHVFGVGHRGSKVGRGSVEPWGSARWRPWKRGGRGSIGHCFFFPPRENTRKKGKKNISAPKKKNVFMSSHTAFSPFPRTFSSVFCLSGTC